MFDFSASKVEESMKESLKKLQLPYVDLIQVTNLDKNIHSPYVQYTILIVI